MGEPVQAFDFTIIMEQRIGYIDSLRGFAIILVVMTHITTYCFCGNYFSFNDVLSVFRMPLFFFIGGFVMNRPGKFDGWRLKDWGRFIGKKILPLTVPAILFILLYSLLYNHSLSGIITDSSKGGYWFTLVYLAFYLFWTVLYVFLGGICKMKGRTVVSLCLLAGIGIYLGSFFIVSPFNPWKNITVNKILSIWHMHYFLYFTAGAFVRFFQEKFTRLLGNQVFLFTAVLVFFAGSIFRIRHDSNIVFTAMEPFLALSSIAISFFLFKMNEELLSGKSAVGKALNYIGRYTLDIYLLHILLIPWNLKIIGKFFETNPSPTLEFILSFLIAAVVVGLCLLISRLIRSSDIMSKIVFGRVI